MKKIMLAILLLTSSITYAQNDLSQKLANASNSFSFELHSKLTKEGNLIYSPFSLTLSLSMLYFGATNDTALEMRKVLKYEEFGLTDEDVENGFDKYINKLQTHSIIPETFWRSKPSTENYTLDIASTLLVQKCFNITAEYSLKLRNRFQAEVKNVDFNTNGNDIVEDINSWVAEKTRGKIMKLIDVIEPGSLMMLLNAVYFKGLWEVQFDREKTTEAKFFKTKTASTPVQMMHAINSEFRYADLKENNFRVLELPYKSSSIRMWILLPNKRDGLQELEKLLTTELITSLNSSLLMKEFNIVAVPKFKIKYDNELSNILSDMGMATVFNGGYFNGITEQGGLSVTELIHTAVIEVDEDGSEAAAITGLAVGLSLPVEKKINFYVDHPFLFFLLDTRSGMVLFTGRVTDI